jgi:hypothetical protein
MIIWAFHMRRSEISSRRHREIRMIRFVMFDVIHNDVQFSIVPHDVPIGHAYEPRGQNHVESFGFGRLIL